MLYKKIQSIFILDLLNGNFNENKNLIDIDLELFFFAFPFIKKNFNELNKEKWFFSLDDIGKKEVFLKELSKNNRLRKEIIIQLKENLGNNNDFYYIGTKKNIMEKFFNNVFYLYSFLCVIFGFFLLFLSFYLSLFFLFGLLMYIIAIVTILTVYYEKSIDKIFNFNIEGELENSLFSKKIDLSFKETVGEEDTVRISILLFIFIISLLLVLEWVRLGIFVLILLIYLFIKKSLTKLIYIFLLKNKSKEVEIFDDIRELGMLYFSIKTSQLFKYIKIDNIKIPIEFINIKKIEKFNLIIQKIEDRNLNIFILSLLRDLDEFVLKEIKKSINEISLSLSTLSKDNLKNERILSMRKNLITYENLFYKRKKGEKK